MALHVCFHINESFMSLMDDTTGIVRYDVRLPPGDSKLGKEILDSAGRKVQEPLKVSNLQSINYPSNLCNHCYQSNYYQLLAF